MTMRLTYCHKRRATTLVESAFVMSILLLFLFGILEYGRLMMTRQILDNAVREGARFAIVHTYDKTAIDVQNVVDQVLGGQGAQLQGYNKTTSIQVFKVDPTNGSNLGPWTNATFGDSIAVTISGTYKPILPVYIGLPSTITVQAQCIMKSEAN